VATEQEEARRAFKTWLDGLERRHPALHADLKRRRAEPRMAERTGFVEEAAVEGMPTEAADLMVLETIVRDGRPALLVQDDRITFAGVEADDASEEIIGKLRPAAAVIQPLLPLVGRIDVDNYPGNAPFLGTGWLVDRNIVVTNRHVAELMTNADGAKFSFKPGRFGESLRVAMDYRREHELPRQAVAKVKRIVWIEPNPRLADIAFLEVEVANDGVQRGHFKLATSDPVDLQEVAVVGYPARASSRIIPDQSRMDKIYGATYDIKRIAPGLMGAGSRGWATHDCTTLGGNSGSVVVDLESGKAVALHFAGLYLIENYAVPASQIQRYLQLRPWQPGAGGAVVRTDRKETPAQPQPQAVQPINPPRTVSVTIPVTIDVTIGDPQVRQLTARVGGEVISSPAANIESAAQAFAQQYSGGGVLAVRPGALLERGALTADEGLIVSVAPERVDSLAKTLPRDFSGFAVVVVPASIADQLGQSADVPGAEAVSTIAYNDDDRTGKSFSFDWVHEKMRVQLHVGPERSWTVLDAFLKRAGHRLVSSMYEFHAKHIADAIDARLKKGADMMLVLARQTRNPNSGKIPKGDFDRETTFGDWRSRSENFRNVYVPLGSAGLVANAYHIKVTVADDDDVWLSSGNWKRASQPLIDPQDLDDPAVTSRAGNREWHVVLKNSTLAGRFRSHIAEDFKESEKLGGTPEAVEDETWVDVPQALLEGVEFEAAADRVLEPQTIGPRMVRVKPLLTPDREGRIYTDAVLELIESAQQQLVFQNQYIKFAGVSRGNLKKLVDALCAKSDEIEDFRIILRSGGDGFWDDMRALRRNGLDVNRCVRRLANTHTKGIVVDGRKVLVGSHNWSGDGVSLNRDASLIFDDEEIAGYYLQAFEVDWNRTRPLSAEESVPEAAPRLAVGESPPAGFVRMTLSDYLEG